ncbi:MAG: hydrolase, partial [Synergistaceae bacterium]|nr:hydrolase [Synergistaceae bacterium]
MYGTDYVVGRGVVADGSGMFLENGAIRVCEGKIREIGPWESVKKDGIPFYDVEGRLIIPGLVNFHQHLYSFFAPGFSPDGPADTFPEILENLWWKLDSSIDEDILYYSSLLGALDSLSYGVTAVFDHHASMNLDRGSLA